MRGNLLERARREGNPLVDGEKVTFVWQGDAAPHLMDDLHGWEDHPQKLKSISPGLWACSFTLPRDAYFEYAFIDLESGQRLRDPLNRKRVNNGVGSYNHTFYMPGAGPSPLTRKQPGIPHGTIRTHTVDTWMLRNEGRRRIHFYHPPRRGKVPLLVVYDGPDYMQRGHLPIIVDNLIAARRIRPIAMAFLPNGGALRGVEYACSDATLAWITHEVLPLAGKELNLVDPGKQPGAFGVMGASFGGLMSVYTGLRLPGIFGHIISQSAVFEWEGQDFVAVELIRHAPARPRIYMDVGSLDFLLEDNRRIVPLLREKDFDLTYHEYGGAHNYTSWGDHVHLGLEKMFG
jgi:enterochelin esterase family protein